MHTNYNTKKSGVAKTIIFKSGRLYKAVCLDFDIIEEADSREDVEKQIKEAVVGYIKNVCKNNLNDELLNRHAAKRYWDKYDKYLELIGGSKKVKANDSSDISNTSIFTMPISQRALCAA